MRLVINSANILRLSGLENAYQVAKAVKVAVPTAHRYIKSPQKVLRLDLAVFPQMVVDLLGITPTDLLEMKVGDLFSLAE